MTALKALKATLTAVPETPGLACELIVDKRQDVGDYLGSTPGASSISCSVAIRFLLNR